MRARLAELKTRYRAGEMSKKEFRAQRYQEKAAWKALKRQARQERRG
ncbi:MAG: hypothetical protein H8E45_07850 [Proteobacteria bacterium]|nr:hypothetical protein [Pseudomonadota bacterium]